LTTAVATDNGTAVCWIELSIGPLLVQYGIGAIPYLGDDISLAAQWLSVFGMQRADVNCFCLVFRPWVSSFTCACTVELVDCLAVIVWTWRELFLFWYVLYYS